MKRFLLIILCGCLCWWSAPASAQLPAGGLSLWLKADSLGLPNGAPVTQWVDSSSHQTVFAPRTVANPDGPFGGGPVEEHPHLEVATVNGKSFPTVRFDRDGSVFNVGDPNVDGSGSTDRLFQVNNRTPGSDPLAIGDGSSVTTFTVMKPDVTTSGALGVQVVWAKRGNDASLLELGLDSDGRYVYVTYDAVTAYRTANPASAGAWQIVAQKITEAGANDPISVLVNDTQDAASPLVANPVTSNGGVIADRNDSINEDPVGLVEPFGIGGHAQDCCGEGETFAGNIAEIIIYARALSTNETDQVYAYLTNKYLAPLGFLPGDYNSDGSVDAGDYVVWRDNFGQFVGLPNENPMATTEGFVDQEDYDYWVQHYGSTTGSSATARHVAEPTSACLAVGAGVLLLASLGSQRGKRRRPSRRPQTSPPADSILAST